MMRFQSSDRFLLGIIGGTVVLVVVALVMVLTRSTPDYRPDNEPSAVVFNYLLAIQRGDYERAYTYLSPTLPGYPSSVQKMRSDLSWLSNSNEEVSFAIADTKINGDQATVTVRETRFYRGGLIGGSQTTSTFTMDLQRNADGWQLIGSTSWEMWSSCWSQKGGCS
ncbi:hypothetical protein [Chloroflexus sp.]|uniref:Rv0361 family membrane protein n=1 Tax=Chloroflexus sp. TaxID=1904827 RepID=UPI0025834266|nr:hypothetical protein [Chloroflexus sp.]